MHLSCTINKTKRHPAEAVNFMVHKVYMTNVSRDCNWGWLAHKGAFVLGVYWGKKHLRDIKGALLFQSGTESRQLCLCSRVCVCV